MSAAAAPARVLVWDLPVRVLHAALALGVTGALVLGFAVDDDHPLFAYHILSGLFAAGALGLRVVWGLVGPGPARFARWPLSPGALVRHVRALVGRARAEEHEGHNPLASWVLLGLLAVTGATVATGFAGGDDVHEALAIGLAGGVGLHLAGLLLHRFLTGENPAPAMVDGRRRVAAVPAFPVRVRAVPGLVCCAALGLWAAVLVRGFDPGAGSLRLPFGLPTIALPVDGDGGEHDHDRDDHDDD